MIDYMSIIAENWENSSFLEKNKLILLLFYLYKKELSILDYKFKFCYELDFLNSISNKDAVQIKKDWEYIVEKIKKGEAHLLSEGDTFYLGACTKASDSSVRRQQPNSEITAKPRAFSLKQSYLNYIIQNEILNTHEDYKSISEENKAIDEKIKDKLEGFIGKTDNEIIEELGLVINKKQKQYKITLANFMISGSNSKIEEFEKANVKLRVITLENNGNLKESISFPHFDYREIVNQDWEHSDLYRLFEEKRFLFVIFKKDKEDKSISFQGWKFWNFPAFDMEEAQRIWELNKEMIQSGKYDSLPKVLFLENVDRLLKSPAKQRGRDFAIMLSSLASLGYAVEWRIINAADYGFPQRRRRVYILGYKKNTSIWKSISKCKDKKDWIIKDGVIAKVFKVKTDNIKINEVEVGLDPVFVSNKFSKDMPSKSPFENSGVMINKQVFTAKVEADYKGKYSVLGDFIIDEKNVPEEYFIKDSYLKKWEYLKGGKKEERESKDGFKYFYSEGGMVFPDALDKPSRTIVTGEGGASPSRFKHVIRTKSGRLRRLTPIELEQLNMFPKNHTAGAPDITRAFIMGNALVVGVIKKLGKSLRDCM